MPIFYFFFLKAVMTEEIKKNFHKLATLSMSLMVYLKRTHKSCLHEERCCPSITKPKVSLSLCYKVLL